MSRRATFLQAIMRGGIASAPPESRVVVGRRAAPTPAPAPTREPEPEAERTRPEALDPSPSSLAAAPPPSVAILEVWANAHDRDPTTVSFTGHSVLLGLTHGVVEGPRRRPQLALGGLAHAGGRPPSQVVGLMHQFSKDNADVGKWINELRERVQEELHLVVIDLTEFEIPWELVVLPAPGPGRQKTYLGAVVGVSRWLGVVDNMSYDQIRLSFDDVEHCGSVAGWIDSVGLAGHGPEQATLRRLGARLEPGVRELVRLLQDRATGVALVYVAAHGRYAPDSMDFAIGVGGQDERGLMLNLLAAMELQLFRSSSAVVFLNVCHAGRVFEDRRLGSGPGAPAPAAQPVGGRADVLANRLRGFPESFLGHGAKGVIATTGYVNDEDAAEMAKWLLARLADVEEPAGRPIAQLLREWREHVRESLPESWNDWTEQHNRKLLTACMYVYYGNPFLRVRIGSSP